MENEVNVEEKDSLTILNYPGSKKKLLNFIHDKVDDYLVKDKAFLDIFGGTNAVGYSMKKDITVYSNDSERYSFEIAKALIENNDVFKFDQYKSQFEYMFNKNYEKLFEIYNVSIEKEREFLDDKNIESLISLYSMFTCAWQDEICLDSIVNKSNKEFPYNLFLMYYSTSYFGFKQSCQIDSIRYAIESSNDEIVRSILFSCLFFAMKEAVFSKDGHMAQPLDMKKNKSKLIKQRKVDIYEIFKNKIKDFTSDNFIISNFKNKSFNYNFSTLLNSGELGSEVGFIYADPPYTDMQYSRYFHILNTVVLYDYPRISYSRGKISSGIYREGRFQSNLSKRSTAKQEIENLFRYCKDNNINLGLSFGYPRDIENQKTDRYTMSIDNINDIATTIFGKENVNIESEEYQHSNNRNSSNKKVNEYLILCRY